MVVMPRFLIFDILMFSGSFQPAIVSLFSATGSEPLCLWSLKTDPSLPADSFACFLNDSESTPAPPDPAVLVSPHPVAADSSDGPVNSSGMGHTLTQTVLHMQSPSLTTTHLRCPPEGRARMGREGDLGLKHPWLHIQVRNIGRPWSFELGLVDWAGKEGIVRCSTFQVDLVFSRAKRYRRRKLTSHAQGSIFQIYSHPYPSVVH